MITGRDGNQITWIKWKSGFSYEGVTVMAEELRKKGGKEQLKALCPLVDNMRFMLGAARHAFNRHSQAELEKIARLHYTITLDIDPFFERVEAGLEKASEADKPDLLKLQGIVSNLELMAHKLSGLAEPISRKGNHGAILSDKDFFHINDLFSQQAGFMRALVDIFQHNDAALKAYVLNESRKVREACFRDEVDHETRMMDSPGQPDAWSIYIAILEHFRDSLGHLITIVESLE
jgi:Na+/phosphate symporter